MTYHDPSACEGRSCCIHSPSDHHMRGWLKNLRESGLVERICHHGTGHPDPDSLAYFRREFGTRDLSVHGCCGCCSPPPVRPVDLINDLYNP